MRITLSIIKADIGSIGGHIKPSRQLIERVREFVDNKGKGLIDDLYISYTGDDIALFFAHQKGTGNEDVHSPPIVSCHAFCVHDCKFTEPVDAFDHPLWDYVRDKVARKAIELREQGFSGAAMLPYSELEYGGIVERMKKLDKQFKIRT